MVNLTDHGQLPIGLLGTRLDDIGDGVHTQHFPGVFEGDCPVELGTVDLRSVDSVLGTARAVSRTGALARCMDQAAVLIGPGQDQDGVIGQVDSGRVPPLVAHIRGVDRVSIGFIIWIGVAGRINTFRIG